MRFQAPRAGQILHAVQFFIGALLVGCGSDGAPKAGFAPPPPPAQPVLVRVLVVPEAVTLQSGMTQQFTATGELTDGSTTTLPAVFSATGGAISGGGLYTAGSLPGSYQVIATEPSGPLADTASVIISAPPDQVPTANANGPYSGLPGSPIQFSSAGSFDPEGSWTASWDFGNGSGATGPTPTHSYATAGNYSAALTITDQIGQTDIDVATVSVSSGPGPTVLVQEPFEDANFASRGWYDMGGSLFELDPVNPHSGSNAGKFTWQAGATHTNGAWAGRVKFPATETVYLEYWVRYSGNYIGSGRPFHPHEWQLMVSTDGDYVPPANSSLTMSIETLYAGGNIVGRIGGTDQLNIDQTNIGVDLTAVTENRGSMGCNGLLESSHTDVSCFLNGPSYLNGRGWMDSGVTIANADKTNWNKVGFYIKLNSISGGIGQPDGILRYWINDVLVMDHQNVVIRTGQHPTMKLDKLFLAPYIGVGSPVTQTIWYDDLVVATGP